ncbi:6-bladed beta-propeller [Bacteroides sp. 519]|uniref:6-bladed beta-propeller n=1 Tax=Bacteroides sp. 519 TaxID=2302937 RepID=UPI0013D71FF6|nr:6-bladed beta-propeller [Bacteroides sp. 519]NDV58510.1 6-bladed beta-propeller [Bacteroides sp. 519]
MMNPIAIFLLSFLSILGVNNAKNQQSDVEVIKVDFQKEYKHKKFPYTNYSMTIQKLEESEDYPIGQVDKLIVDHNRIYILDSSKAKSLFVYNRDGKLQHIINKKGRGPGEFVLPDNFNIEKKTGNIVIMDTNSRKFIYYSPKGEYIKEIKYDFMAVDFILDKDDNIIVNNGNFSAEKTDGFFLFKLSQDGKMLDKFFPSTPLNPSVAAFNPRKSLRKYGTGISFLPTVSNCIYLLDGNKSKAMYEIDFGKDWPSKDFFEKAANMHPLKVREQILDNNYAFFLNYIQTKDVLHIDFYKGKNYSFYYNKKTKQSLLLSMEDENVSFPLATYNDEFIFIKYNEDTGEPIVVFYTVDFDL